MNSAVGHGYLLSRNFTYNGGLISTILSEITFVNNSNKITVTIGNIDIANYIKDFFFKPTKLAQKFDLHSDLITTYETISNFNLVTTTVGLIYIAIPCLLCLLLSFFWILWQGIREHPQIQICCHKINKSCSNYSKYLDSVNLSILSEDEIQKKRKRFLNKNLIISIICGVLAIAYVISFLLSAVSQTSVQYQLVSTNTNNSLLSSWKQVSQNIDSFFNLILVDSYQMFNTSLDSMSSGIQNLLSTSLNNLRSSLMTSFGVTALFSTLTNLLSNLNVTVNSMNYVTLNSRAILSNIDNLKGKFSVYQTQLQNYIRSVCNQQSADITCQQYLTESNLLNVPITTSLINTESSVNMLFILQNFHLNLTQLTTQVQNLQVKFNDEIQAITNAKIKELNLDQSINNVRVIWNFISSFMLPVKNNFAQTSNTLLESLKTGTSVYIIISTLILVLVFLISCYYLFSSSRYAIINYFESIILFDRMNAPPTRPIFVLHHLKKQRFINLLQRDYTSPRWAIHTYLFIFSWILIFLIMSAILSIFLSELLYNETCVQLWNPIGLQNTDKIINSFMTTQWTNINAYIKSMLNLAVTLNKPNKLLETIQNNCTNDNGLLKVLGWTKMINISSFVWSTQNLNTLQSGLNLTYDMIIGVNTKNLMPPDMASFLNMASNITKYFDEIDYTSTINELAKGAIALPNISLWLDGAVNYFSAIKTQDSSFVIQYLETIRSNLPSINNIQIQLNQLLSNYIQIQQTRVNNHFISELLSRSSFIQTNFVPSPSTYQTVATTYSSIMLTNFTTQSDILLTKEVGLLLDKLFPCRDLSAALRILLNNMCNANQLLETLANNGFMLIILSVILIFIFHVHWILIRIEYSDNAETNISKC